MKKIILLSFAAFSFIGNAQTTTPAVPAEKEWDVSMYGFIRTDYIYDSRKESSVREDQLNLYPLDVAKDINGKDVNAVGQSNFLAITSRLGAKVKGPNVWGAKMNGTLEGDFYGNTEASIGLFRLRHAFVTMDWTKTQVTMGQTWYPTFIPEVFPGVANFNTGIMFNPFGWATQAKVKQNFTKEFSAALTVYKEREFAATATTIGTQNSASINSAVPSLNLVFQFKNQNWIAGLGAEYKSIQPLTDNGGTPTTKLATTEKVNSSSVFGYAKYSNDKFLVKVYGISGGNLNSLVMLGGFTGTTNAGIQSFDPIKTTAYWVDIAGNGKAVAPGLFFGYTKNNGASTAASTTGNIYMRGISGSRVVDNVWRASARVDFKKNKFRLTPELEYTAATWGDVDLFGKAGDNKTNVGNVRAMVSCVYSF